ncbi:MAG: MOSC domain-containing protein [Armatimonas sp.]
MYLDLLPQGGFEEDTWVGRRVRIGSTAVVAVLKRDSRCAMITFDPDTGVSDPAILRQVAQGHENKAGVYGAVLVEGIIHQGDAVELFD